MLSPNFKSLVVFILFSTGVSAQNLDALFESGVQDAQRFAQGYFNPAMELGIHNLSGGWYNSGKSKKTLAFEVSLIGNVSTWSEKQESFLLNTASYSNLKFADGTEEKYVSTVLGDGSTSAYAEESLGEGLPNIRTDFSLPAGLRSEGIQFLPSAFLQASLGLIKGIEIKGRFLPSVSSNDLSVSMLGGGVQFDISEILPLDRVLPLGISFLLGYTQLDANYQIESNQSIESQIISRNMSLIVSTRLPVFNLYGGVGLISGSSDLNLLGTYQIASGVDFVDPIALQSEVSDIGVTLGAKLKLGFFRLNVDHSFSEFNTTRAGINIGLR
jgi:hypothetical protein